jgi:perosamine synthetase
VDENKPFIPISKPSITEKEIAYGTDAIRSTWISSLGKYIDEFERKFAEFSDAKYGVALMNGTVAIQLALEASGIKAGDEVIIPDLSFVATANAVLYLNAIPVFVDIDPFNLCMDPDRIESVISPKTKAIIPVHLYGHPADMVHINEIAKKHNLIVVEDAAEAHGATINGKKVGSWGHCATFSFYGNKNITTGEGGMITTNDEKLYQRCRFLRDHAMSTTKRYWHPEKGYNFRMTNIQAAIGVAQLERIKEITESKNRVFNAYHKRLKNHPKISINKTSSWATNAFWLIAARLEGITESQRDELIKWLKEDGVDSRPFFYPMSDLPYLPKTDNTPVTHAIFKEGINLPTYFDLSDSDIDRVCDSLIRFMEKLKYKVQA